MSSRKVPAPAAPSPTVTSRPVTSRPVTSQPVTSQPVAPPGEVLAQRVYHSTFVIERVYPSAPARVFAAWSNPEAKRRWFACSDGWDVEQHLFDFRVGGRERLSVGPPGGPLHVMEARYHDIVADERLIYAYDMYVGDIKLSTSLVTLELERCAEGTRFRFTEQGAFLRGEADAREREEGTRIGLGGLYAEVMREG